MKIYWHDERKNVVGRAVRKLRMDAQITQKQLAEKAQLLGYEFDRLTVLRIESGDRFVADYEVKALADALGVEISTLYDITT
ncbi:helix-turn-helix domain-containing protein [Eubacteriales bacterium OttesenSCG-928-N13]|nr:helix-turn-helix domain-containing protein [Eubacteriales bacterium OttesenSCG-928-N13]